MDINRENYTKSLENIKPSEKFLSETKKLMLEEAEKNTKSEKTGRPLLMKLTPFAAAAACIALIAAAGVNVLRDKSVETVKAADNSVYTGEVSEENIESEAVSDSAAEEEEYINDLIADEALSEAIKADKAGTAESDGAAESSSEPIGDMPAFFAAGDTDNSGRKIADNSTAADELSEADVFVPETDDEIPTEEEEFIGYADSGADCSETPTDDNFAGGNLNEDIVEDFEDDIEDDAENFVGDKPVAPAFSRIAGGKASDYPDFLPTDTEKLREFLALVSRDDINAEVTVSDGKSSDIFGEKALALNNAFAEAAENLSPDSGEGFAPTLSFSVFDNVSGDILYTVKTDGCAISVQIKNGEAFYFSVGESALEAVMSAAE